MAAAPRVCRACGAWACSRGLRPQCQRPVCQRRCSRAERRRRRWRAQEAKWGMGGCFGLDSVLGTGVVLECTTDLQQKAMLSRFRQAIGKPGDPPTSSRGLNADSEVDGCHVSTPLHPSPYRTFEHNGLVEHTSTAHLRVLHCHLAVDQICQLTSVTSGRTAFASLLRQITSKLPILM